jgi:general stress protein CsbA
MYWITGILGLALILAPFVFGFSANTSAMWSSIVLGAVITLASIVEGWTRDDRNWEYWVVAILAPFVLGFSSVSGALWTAIILGAVVALLAGTKVFASTA